MKGFFKESELMAKGWTLGYVALLLRDACLVGPDLDSGDLATQHRWYRCDQVEAAEKKRTKLQANSEIRRNLGAIMRQRIERVGNVFEERLERGDIPLSLRNLALDIVELYDSGGDGGIDYVRKIDDLLSDSDREMPDSEVGTSTDLDVSLFPDKADHDIHTFDHESMCSEYDPDRYSNQLAIYEFCPDCGWNFDRDEA